MNLSARNPRVWLVEGDAKLRNSLAGLFEQEGYEMCAEPDGSDLEGVLQRFRPDLAILDLSLPGRSDGYSLARRIRDHGDMPIVFITAADSPDARVEAFKVGGDDYIVKPILMAELLGRVRAILRRAGRERSAVWQVDDLVIDEGGRTAVFGGLTLDLTATEFELLLSLVRHRGRVLSKAQLMSHLWGIDDDVDPNRLEFQVSSLRRKLEAHGPRLIHTVRGVGYVFKGSPRLPAPPARRLD